MTSLLEPMVYGLVALRILSPQSRYFITAVKNTLCSLQDTYYLIKSHLLILLN